MPKQLAPDLWSVNLDGRGTRYFRSLTLACLYTIDPDNPLFGSDFPAPSAQLADHQINDRVGNAGECL